MTRLAHPPHLSGRARRGGSRGPKRLSNVPQRSCRVAGRRDPPPWYSPTRGEETLFNPPSPLRSAMTIVPCTQRARRRTVDRPNRYSRTSSHWPDFADRSTASVTKSVARASRNVGSPASPRARPQEVCDLVDERVLVADLQARNPPVLHIGMVAVGDMQRAPAAQPALVAMVEILQPMQIVQVP